MTLATSAPIATPASPTIQTRESSGDHDAERHPARAARSDRASVSTQRVSGARLLRLRLAARASWPPAATKRNAPPLARADSGGSGRSALVECVLVHHWSSNEWQHSSNVAIDVAAGSRRRGSGFNTDAAIGQASTISARAYRAGSGSAPEERGRDSPGRSAAQARPRRVVFSSGDATVRRGDGDGQERGACQPPVA